MDYFENGKTCTVSGTSDKSTDGTFNKDSIHKFTFNSNTVWKLEHCLDIWTLFEHFFEHFLNTFMNTFSNNFLNTFMNTFPTLFEHFFNTFWTLFEHFFEHFWFYFSVGTVHSHFYIFIRHFIEFPMA
jgi:hypothetical protein